MIVGQTFLRIYYLLFLKQSLNNHEKDQVWVQTKITNKYNIYLNKEYDIHVLSVKGSKKREDPHAI